MTSRRFTRADHKLSVVVGGQFGSEAKGHFTEQAIQFYKGSFDNTVNVRVAGPNAGHTAYEREGERRRFSFRQLPVGALDRDVELAIAAGSEIDLPVLLDEIQRVEDAGYSVKGRLVVDPEVTMLYEHHKVKEQQFNLVKDIGSTGKGIGSARSDRIMRKATRLRDDLFASRTLLSAGIAITPVADWVHGLMEANVPTHVVIEGTQGYGLGLHAGYYPHCTSSDCRAIDFCAMAGLNPWDFKDFKVYVVCRVYPIRVAGNSGPMRNETSWEELGLPEEYTTVTQKVRRVGHWDTELVRRALRGNGRASQLVVTMLDQRWPEIAGVDSFKPFFNSEASSWLFDMADELGVRPVFAGTGPKTGVWL